MHQKLAVASSRPGWSTKVVRALIVALIAPQVIFYCSWLLRLQKRIFLPLLPNRRLRTMARNDNRLVGQGQDAAVQ